MPAGPAVLAPHRPQAQAYITGIDSLRALAVLAVLVYHLHAAWLPGGFLGVDVFFAISGYVVASSLARAGTAGGSLGSLALHFYSRRLVRLYPALLLCLVSSFALMVLFVPSSWLSSTVWATGLMAFAGLGNVALVWLAEPYFSPRAEFNPFTHTWSLGVEEQFYLIFPWLVLGWLVVSAARPRRRWAWVPMGVLGVASLLFAAWASAHRPELGFYLLPARLWELAVGVGLAWAHARVRLLSSGWAARAPVMALLGSLVIAGSLFAGPPGSFPWPGALPVLLGTLACLQALAAASAGGRPLRWAAWPVSVYLGQISYVLYLWHWPVLVLMRWTTGLDGWGPRLAAVLLSLALAVLTHHAVEQPWRRRFARARPLPVLGWGWGAVGLVLLLSLGLVQGRPWLSQTQAMKAADDWYPVATAADRELLREPGGGDAARPTLFVVGDSHAMAYAPLLARVQARTGWPVRVMAEAGCAVAKPDSQMAASCGPFLSGALQRVLREARPGDLLFLPGLRHARLADQWQAQALSEVLASETTPDAESARRAAAASARVWLARLTAAGVQVVLEGPKPVFAAPAFRCVDWFNRGHPVCAQGLQMPREALRVLLAPTQEMLATPLRPGVVMWQPFEHLCPSEVCHALDEQQRPLFFDADHLSRRANLLLTDDFLATLRGLVAGGRERPPPDGR